MEKTFARMLDRYVPPMERTIMEGIAYKHMENAEEYVAASFKAASKGFPEGLIYEGFMRVPPRREYLETTKSRSNSKSRTFDIAKSNLYLVEHYTSYKGTPVPPIKLFYPYVEKGGWTVLNGSLFKLPPVLTDKVLTPGYDKIFVKFINDKENYRRTMHTILINGVRESNYMVFTKLYRRSEEKGNKILKTVTTNAHYLFAKFGVAETFKKYCNTDIVAGYSEINETNFDKDNWLIYASTKFKPKTCFAAIYEPSNLRMAIPKNLSQNESYLAKMLITAFFHVIDHFPDRFNKENFSSKTLWKITMGYIVFGDEYGENTLYQKIDEHVEPLADHMDMQSKAELKEIGIFLEDFFDLLVYLIVEFNKLIANVPNSPMSMFGKSLKVLYYAFYDITSAIFTVNHVLSKQPKGKELTVKDISKKFSDVLKPRIIFRIIDSSLATESFQTPSDNMYMGITYSISEQESSVGTNKKSKTKAPPGPENHLDISMVQAGTATMFSKLKPSPMYNINPYTYIDYATSTIMPNPKFVGLMARTEAMLKYKVRER